MAPLPPPPPVPGFDETAQRLRAMRESGAPDGAAACFVAPTPSTLGLPTRTIPVTQDAWNSMGFSDIRDKANPISVADLFTAERAVKKVAGDITAAFDTFVGAIKAAMDAKWQGAAGSKATNALAAYVNEALVVAQAAHVTANQIGSLGHVMDNTKTTLPQGTTSLSVADRTKDLLNPWGDANYEREKNAADKRARDIMQTTYWGQGIDPMARVIPAVSPPKSPTTGDVPVSDGHDPSAADRVPGAAAPGSGQPAPNAPGPEQPGDPAAPQQNPQAQPNANAQD
ncbi:MAG: hypothetical protein HOQ24_16020, partial [Mycobacteriaceae bacterium]|nr:hypothetical protein [Mycobacteriaceae bacterium]